MQGTTTTFAGPPGLVRNFASTAAQLPKVRGLRFVEEGLVVELFKDDVADWAMLLNLFATFRAEMPTGWLSERSATTKDSTSASGAAPGATTGDSTSAPGAAPTPGAVPDARPEPPGGWCCDGCKQGRGCAGARAKATCSSGSCVPRASSVFDDPTLRMLLSL